MRKFLLMAATGLALAACQQPGQQTMRVEQPVGCENMPNPAASGSAVVSTAGMSMKPSTEGCEAMPSGTRPGQTVGMGATAPAASACDADAMGRSAAAQAECRQLSPGGPLPARPR